MLVEKAMKDGACGLSTGLIYNPGTYAKTDEIVALAKVAAKHGGLYASHIRNEAGGLLDAIEEALAHRQGGRVPRPHLAHQGERQVGVGHQSADAVRLDRGRPASRGRT